MKFIHRLGYYLGGFAIGLIFLAFFLSGKRTSCAYGPEARVLKNINGKKHFYSPEALSIMASYDLDSNTVAQVLKSGDVDFKLSDTKRDSCKTYAIKEKLDERLIMVTVANCDSIANIINIDIMN